jgi:hypothetical protein
MLVVHARHALFVIGIAERVIGAGAVGVAHAHDTSAARGVALRPFLAGDGASGAARALAGVIGGLASVNRGGAIVVARADGARAAHAPRFGGRTGLVGGAFDAPEYGIADERRFAASRAKSARQAAVRSGRRVVTTAGKRHENERRNECGE